MCRVPIETKELVATFGWNKLQEYLKKKTDYRLPTIDEVKELTSTYQAVWFNGRLEMDDGYGDKMGVYDFKYKTIGYAHPDFKMNVILIKDEDGTK